MAVVQELSTGAEFHWSPTDDPLGLGNQLEQLPGYNTASEWEPLAAALSQGVRAAQELGAVSPEVALRSLNTLDLFAMSYLRAGGNPMTDIAGLESAMGSFGLAAGTVPRATLHTYIRGSSLTGTPQEELFRHSLTESYLALEPAFAALSAVDFTAEAAPDHLTDALLLTSDAMVTTSDVMEGIIADLPEAEFVDIIRPYFENLTINGVTYSAANGGQIQLPAIDYMINGRGDSGKRGQFHDSQLPYLSPAERQALANYQNPQTNGTKTVLQYIADRLEAGHFDGDLIAAASRVIQQIVDFRGRHYGYARRSWKHREPGAKGSAGEDTEFLAALIRETVDDKTTLQRLQDAHQRLAGSR